MAALGLYLHQQKQDWHLEKQPGLKTGKYKLVYYAVWSVYFMLSHEIDVAILVIKVVHQQQIKTMLVLCPSCLVPQLIDNVM